MKLFALNGSNEFGELVAKELHIALSKHEERSFEDGEHKSRPLENVRNEDVFIIHSLYSDPSGSVNDKLCRLLFFTGAVRDAAAKSVTVVTPYLCYARKDRKTKPRDPVTTRYVAQLFEAMGIIRMVTLDIHNVQSFQNAFRCLSENLEAKKIFAEHLMPLIGNEDAVIVSPDIGGIKRAEQFQQYILQHFGKNLSLAFMEKYRSGNVISGSALMGNVENRTTVILDDLISTGSTIARTAETCKKAGAKKVYALATHGLFTGTPDNVFTDDVDEIIITNTVRPFRLDNTKTQKKVTVLNAAPLFAAAIDAINKGGSVTALLEE